MAQMKARTLIIHAVWASLAVAAFLLGRAPEEIAASPGDPQELGFQRAAARPGPASWTYGPGDAPDSFVLAMTSVLAEPDEELRAERAAALMLELTPQVWEGLTPAMVPGLLELFRLAKPSGETWHKERDFFGAWARIDPRAAFAHVIDEANDDFGANAWGRPAVLEEWAKSDRAAAEEAVLGVEESYARYSVAHRLITHLSKTDLDAAIAFSARYEMVEGNRHHAGAGTLAKRLLDERDVGGVQQWLNDIDFGEKTIAYKQQALEYLAYSRTGDGMAALLAARENQEFLNTELLGKISNSATKGGNDEERAEGRLDWLAKLPPEVGLKRDALGEQFERYLKLDFKAASAWLVGQELGPGHDEALRIFVRDATMDDVPKAMLWAKRISDPQLRSETIRFVQDRGGR